MTLHELINALYSATDPHRAEFMQLVKAQKVENAQVSAELAHFIKKLAEKREVAPHEFETVYHYMFDSQHWPVSGVVAQVLNPKLVSYVEEAQLSLLNNQAKQLAAPQPSNSKRPRPVHELLENQNLATLLQQKYRNHLANSGQTAQSPEYLELTPKQAQALNATIARPIESPKFQRLVHKLTGLRFSNDEAERILESNRILALQQMIINPALYEFVRQQSNQELALPGNYIDWRSADIEEHIKQLNDAVVQAVDDTILRQRLAHLGLTTVPESVLHHIQQENQRIPQHILNDHAIEPSVAMNFYHYIEKNPGRLAVAAFTGLAAFKAAPLLAAMLGVKVLGSALFGLGYLVRNSFFGKTEKPVVEPGQEHTDKWHHVADHIGDNFLDHPASVLAGSARNPNDVGSSLDPDGDTIPEQYKQQQAGETNEIGNPVDTEAEIKEWLEQEEDKELSEEERNKRELLG